MDESVLQRLSRIYAAIGVTEERDPAKLKGTIIQTDRLKGVIQDFRSGLSDDELLNQAHIVIHNIANLGDHLRKWAAHNRQDKNKVNQTIDKCSDLQIIKDLSNNDKHGYPPRDGGRSGRCPQLTNWTAPGSLISTTCSIDSKASRHDILCFVRNLALSS